MAFRGASTALRLEASDVEGGGMPGFGPHIVVGADGSEASAEALRWAIRQAKLMGAEVRVATGYTYPFMIFLAPTYTEADYERDAVEAQRVTIEKATQGLRDVPLTTTVIETRPARLLTEMARDADLLVVGAHGPDGFTGMHLGSVANYCVHHAPCPVVVVRPPID
jgi:nucleotide-binding universal stress UspA family protein